MQCAPARGGAASAAALPPISPRPAALHTGRAGSRTGSTSLHPLRSNSNPRRYIVNVDELFTGELITGVPSTDAGLMDKMPGGGDNNGDHCAVTA